MANYYEIPWNYLAAVKRFRIWNYIACTTIFLNDCLGNNVKIAWLPPCIWVSSLFQLMSLADFHLFKS